MAPLVHPVRHRQPRSIEQVRRLVLEERDYRRPTDGEAGSDLAIGPDEHRRWSATGAERAADVEPGIEDDWRRQAELTVSLDLSGRNDQELGRVRGLVRLPGLEVVHHALAEAATWVPEKHRRRVASEVSQSDRFAVQIVQLDARRVLANAGDSPRRLSVGRGAVEP